jgi:hypothetical protein
MNPYLTYANNVVFLGIQFPPATKELVTGAKSDPMKLLFTLIIPILLLTLLLLRNNNHRVKAFMINHS